MLGQDSGGWSRWSRAWLHSYHCLWRRDCGRCHYRRHWETRRRLWGHFNRLWGRNCLRHRLLLRSHWLSIAHGLHNLLFCWGSSLSLQLLQLLRRHLLQDLLGLHLRNRFIEWLLGHLRGLHLQHGRDRLRLGSGLGECDLCWTASNNCWLRGGDRLCCLKQRHGGLSSMAGRLVIHQLCCEHGVQRLQRGVLGRLGRLCGSFHRALLDLLCILFVLGLKQVVDIQAGLASGLVRDLICAGLHLDARLGGCFGTASAGGVLGALDLDLHVVRHVLRLDGDVAVRSLPLVRSDGVGHDSAASDVVGSQQARRYYCHGFGLTDRERLMGSHKLTIYLSTIFINSIHGAQINQEL